MTPTPVVRATYEGLPIGGWVGVRAEYTVLRHGDGTFTITLNPLRQCNTLGVFIDRLATAGFYVEHLGMRVDWSFTNAPATAPMPGDGRYPGNLQAPVVASMGADGMVLLGSLDPARPVAVTCSKTSIGLTFIGPFPAGKVEQFRVFVSSPDQGDGSEVGRAVRVGSSYRARLAPAWSEVPTIRRAHGVFALMTQDTSTPVADFVRAWELHYADFGSAIVWGGMSDFGGSCCTPSLELHPRGAALPAVTKALGWPVYGYCRPQSVEGGGLDQEWWSQTVSVTLGRFQGVYADTVGHVRLDPSLVPADAIIEGASLAHPCAALVANAMSGGGFAFGAGSLPLTTPDGRPEPRSTMPWLTSFPALGRAIMDRRVMLEGPHNSDGYFDGLYWTIRDGQRVEWTDALWKFALDYDLWLCPRAVTPAVQSIIDARNAVGWTAMDREWLGPGRFRDRKTGKLWLTTADGRIEEEP